MSPFCILIVYFKEWHQCQKLLVSRGPGGFLGRLSAITVGKVGQEIAGRAGQIIGVYSYEQVRKMHHGTAALYKLVSCL